MKRSGLFKIAVFVMAAWLGTAAAAMAGMITINVKLPNGQPAKHATVRMYSVTANYQIVQYAVQTTSASGKAVFKLHPGACFKAEYGNDGSGRPLYVHGGCPKGNPSSFTIDLNP